MHAAGKGYPSTVVRAATSGEGLPIGVQDVAHPRREDLSLAVAGEIEMALGHFLVFRMLCNGSS
jgi:amidase